MDIISHGLRSGLAFGRKSKKDFLKSIGRGILPDALSFGVFTAATVVGLATRPDRGNHDANQIPQYVHTLYNITHSFFTFWVALGIAYLWKKKIPLPMLGRGLHIFVDIPTHSLNFFGTPFLRPIFPPLVDGISRGNPWIFFSNRGLLILGYGWRIIQKKKK